VYETYIKGVSWLLDRKNLKQENTEVWKELWDFQSAVCR